VFVIVLQTQVVDDRHDDLVGRGGAADMRVSTPEPVVASTAFCTRAASSCSAKVGRASGRRTGWPIGLAALAGEADSLLAALLGEQGRLQGDLLARPRPERFRPPMLA